MNTTHHFWKLITFRPKLYLIDVIAMVFNLGSFILQGLILREFFNYLTGNAQFSLPTIIGGQISYGLMVVGGTIAAMLAFNHFLYHTTALLIRNLFGRILHMPGARPLPAQPDGQLMSTGQAISTMRDDTQEMSFGVALIDDLIGAGVGALAATVVMLSINWVVTVGAFVPLLIVIGIAHALGNTTEKLRTVGRETTSNVTGLIADMFHKTETIKAAGAEERVIAHFRAVNDARKTAMIRDKVMTQFVEALAGGTTDIGMGLVLLLAAQAMYAGSFTVGDFALFAAYVWPITNAMRIAAGLVTRYRQVGVSTKRMHEMMQGMPEGAAVAHNPIYHRHDPPPIPFTPKTEQDHLHTLTVRTLSFRYPDSQNGIHNIDLTLERGSFTVLVGRIGSGKTTLLRVLLGLLPADSGTLHWNDEQIDDLATFMTPPRIAYTAQVPTLFSDTLRENLLLGLPPEQVNIDRALNTAVMENDLAQMANRLETLVGPRGMRLSGGQVQRSAAARMFVREPELYVFDDLSSALDVNTEKLLWERLFAAGSPTCLVVSHRLPALRRADQIVLLKDGRVADVGKLDVLLERSAEMRELVQTKTSDFS